MVFHVTLMRFLFHFAAPFVFPPDSNSNLEPGSPPEISRGLNLAELLLHVDRAILLWFFIDDETEAVDLVLLT